MAKAAKPKPTPARKPSYTALTKSAKVARAPIAKKAVAKANVPAKKTRAPRTPVITKDELRGQIEKLTAVNAILKSKGRETAKAQSAAEGRIVALEHQIRQTETKAAIEEKPT